MDTIAAIATGPGVGGIGIVRLSGEKAFEIGAALFRGKSAFFDMPANYLFHGNIVVPKVQTDLVETIDEILFDETKIDEAMVVKFVAPKSFTKEDVVEIHCHGGRVVLGQILDLVLSQGARLAEPGEFTKRAFLNGRIDLSQAEAVIDIINAKTREGSRTALKQLEGRLSERVGAAKRELVEIIAHLEASVDYPEYDIEVLTSERLLRGIAAASEIVADLIKGYDRGRLLREGVTVVITGRPNVGKSSLLNRMAGRQRAIVTEVPGTTRDVIDEYIDLNGIPVRIVDTAGIRETQDTVEKIGVDMARREIADADVLIVMFDAETGVQQEELEMLEALNKQKDKKIIVLLNKIDKSNKNLGAAVPSGWIKVSLLEDTGVEELIEALGALVAGDVHISTNATDLEVATAASDEPGALRPEQLESRCLDAAAATSAAPVPAQDTASVVAAEAVAGPHVPPQICDTLVTNARHKQLLDSCFRELQSARAALQAGVPVDCLAVDLMAAAGSLAEITGEAINESIVKEIFSKFCIGK